MSHPAPPAAPSRRVPTQRRALERVARIMRAAGELCAESGVDAATMEAIAQRAETSIGSVYQFFPNKDALLAAVAERHVADLVALLDQADAADPAETATLPVPQLVDRVLDPFIAFHRSHPGHYAILFAAQGSGALGPVRGQLRQRLVRRVERLFAARAPTLPAPKRRRLAVTAVEAARAMLQHIETGVPRAGRKAMREELRDMLAAYLAPWLDGR